ncbi:ATP synthase F0 [Colletotrichum navitas]|uniref:ATP synthase F0 n=1 Tax=Colletotrichum navitas TaxID=681940 RepID=A0AAD8Q0D2_9PEZI|nr:ATP synthase F0 [Colletotrichum navitas]KAK1590933.1 ATP synthase F0 [Colletotrichum navitas]
MAADEEGTRPEEDAPLLTHDLPSTVAPTRAYQVKIIGLAMVFILIGEIGAYLQIPPTFQLMEEIICHKHYPGHIISQSVHDNVCKSAEVQGELAMIKGWQTSFGSIPPLLTAIPYGVIADKYGRRPVLSLAMLGIMLEFTWRLQPLLWPDVLPLWTVWFGSAFQFIGGGAGMAAAMVWTMVSDVVPVSNLTKVYFRIGAVALGGQLFVAPLSAYLQVKSPWMPLAIGNILLIIGTCLPPFIPETLELRRAADEEFEQTLHRPEHGTKDQHTVMEQIMVAFRNDMGHIYNFIIKSRRVIPLVAGFNLTLIVKYVKEEIMSQYVHNLFGWSWAKATLVSTVAVIARIIMLLAILPVAGWYITKRTAVHPLTRDLWLVRMTGILLSLGCFMVAVAYTPWFFVIALIIFSFGVSYANLCRAVLNAVVEPHTIGTLNTAISWMEQMSMLVSAPIISGLLRAGNAVGGVWIGLPYMAATMMSISGTVLVFLYRLPGDQLF